MKTHSIKIQPIYFADVITGRKPYEIRKNDRNYKPGDHVVLREWTKESGYTGRMATGKVGAVTDYAQAQDYVVFGFLMEYAEDNGVVIMCGDYTKALDIARSEQRHATCMSFWSGFLGGVIVLSAVWYLSTL